MNKGEKGRQYQDSVFRMYFNDAGATPRACGRVAWADVYDR